MVLSSLDIGSSLYVSYCPLISNLSLLLIYLIVASFATPLTIKILFHSVETI